MKKNILFYNLWHNGDVFSGRGYIKHIINSLPNVRFGYYHINNPKIVSDLVRTQFKPDLKKWQVEQMTHHKIFETEETIYINTWVGAYFYQNQSRAVDHVDFIANLEGEGHANYLSLHKMWKFIIDYLNEKHSAGIQLTDNPLDYVPEIDWMKYETDSANDFIKATWGGKRHLICNGVVRSMQSNLGNLSFPIESVAKLFPKDHFVCTEKFDTNLTNINFTQDIFNLPNDLNEISYLSTRCDTIIGKNSGPFMFTHVKDNINNLDKIFLAMSHNPSDCYTYHMKNLPCKYFFSSNESNVFYNLLNVVKLSHGSVMRLM